MGKLEEGQLTSQRSMLEQQRRTLQELDEPLAALQGTVDNIGRAAKVISGEVNLQNRMLDHTNEATDRVASRMGRMQTMLQTLSRKSSTRCLMCSVGCLLVVLIFLYFQVVDM